jgi:hypothetical protein
MNVTWELFVKHFREAFRGGNLKTLRALKALNIKGFNNLDDLGEEFIKYGPGFSQWDKLITDAHENIRCEKEYDAEMDELIRWQEKIRRAYDRGDVHLFRILDRISPPKRIYFGPGLAKYNNQITPELEKDLSENREAWAAFCSEFNKAFYTGDLNTLTILRSLKVQGFNIPSDIGPQFEKYDSELLGWTELMSDAGLNQNKC